MKEKVDLNVNKIRIGKYSQNGYGEKLIANKSDIEKILSLIRKRGSKCSYFVHSPLLTIYGIELYKGRKLLSKVGVAGNFLRRDDNEWYFIKDSHLPNELSEYTKDIHLINPGTCSFAEVKSH